MVRGYIAVQIQEVTPEIAESLGLKATRGALVAEPQANGPAAKAGIQAGDVITAINGREVVDARDVARTISSMAPRLGCRAKIGSIEPKPVAPTLRCSAGMRRAIPLCRVSQIDVDRYRAMIGSFVRSQIRSGRIRGRRASCRGS